VKSNIGQELLAKAPGLLIGIGIPTAWNFFGLPSLRIIRIEALAVFLIFIGMVWVLTLILKPRKGEGLDLIDWVVNILLWIFGFLATFFIKM